MIALVKFSVLYLTGRNSLAGFVIPLGLLSGIAFAIYAFLVGYLDGVMQMEMSNRAKASGFEQLRLVVGSKHFLDAMTTEKIGELSDLCQDGDLQALPFRIFEVGVGQPSREYTGRTISDGSRLLEIMKFREPLLPFIGEERSGVIIHPELLDRTFSDDENKGLRIRLDFGTFYGGIALDVPVLGVMKEFFTDSREREIKVIIHEDFDSLIRNRFLDADGKMMFNNFWITAKSYANRDYSSLSSADESNILDLLGQLKTTLLGKVPHQSWESSGMAVDSVGNREILGIRFYAKPSNPSPNNDSELLLKKSEIEKWFKKTQVEHKALDNFTLIFPDLKSKEVGTFVEFYFKDIDKMVAGSKRLAEDDIGRAHNSSSIRTLGDMLGAVELKKQMLDICLWVVMFYVVLSLFFLQLQRSVHIRSQIGFLMANGASSRVVFASFTLQSLAVLFVSLILGLSLAVVTGKCFFWWIFNGPEAFTLRLDVILNLLVLLVVVLISTILIFPMWIYRLKKIFPPQFALLAIHELLEEKRL